MPDLNSLVCDISTVRLVTEVVPRLSGDTDRSVGRREGDCESVDR